MVLRFLTFTASTVHKVKLCFVEFTVKGESRRSSIAESYQEGKMPTGQFDNVLQWLSTLQISKNAEDELTLNFSQTSGYRSVLPQDEFYAEADIPE